MLKVFVSNSYIHQLNRTPVPVLKNDSYVVSMISSKAATKLNPTRISDSATSTAYNRVTQVTDENQLPFQPNATEDFPSVETEFPRIPHIIHQAYKDEKIPEQLQQYVKSVIEHNPNWTYYFWTDAAARRLIQERHPYLLGVWDNLKTGIYRGDIIRCIVLYEFGGAYFDLDVENVRALDIVTNMFACILPPEPFEHNILIFNVEVLINNAIMFCRPKHPFFKMILEAFRNVTEKEYVIYATGPALLTKLYFKYTNESTELTGQGKSESGEHFRHMLSPYFFKSRLPLDHDNAILVPNTQYFTDNLDLQGQKGSFVKTCMIRDQKSDLVKRACRNIEMRGYQRSSTFAFTIHRYAHLWLQSAEKLQKMKTVNIRNVVPTCIIY